MYEHHSQHYTAPPPPPTVESYGKSPSSAFPTYSAVPSTHAAVVSAPIEEPLFGDGGHAPLQPPPPGKYQERTAEFASPVWAHMNYNYSNNTKDTTGFLMMSVKSETPLFSYIC